MSGWIKLHRAIQEWEWYTDVNTCHLFIHILLKATHQDYEWRGIKVKTGECICGRKELSYNSGLTEQQVRTSLDKLKKSKNVTIKTTNKYSIISIVNWEKYQDNNQQDNQPITNNQPTSNHIQEHNNIKTEETKNIYNIGKFKKPTIEEISEYCKERKNQVLANKFYDYYESNGWKVGRNKMKDWKAAVRNWEKNNNTAKQGTYTNLTSSYGSDIPL